jgi:8-oxo-dGTP diphosphatase
MEEPFAQLTSVVCLVLMDSKYQTLAVQRPPDKRLGLLWEFPGGKVEAGESLEIALRREIMEELRLQLGKLQALEPVFHDYDFGKIKLFPYLSRCVEPCAFSLTEHVDAVWIQLQDWPTLNWAPADVPILKNLIRMHSEKDL